MSKEKEIPKVVELLIKAHIYNIKTHDKIGQYWDTNFDMEVEEGLEEYTGMKIKDLIERYKKS